MSRKGHVSPSASTPIIWYAIVSSGAAPGEEGEEGGPRPGRETPMRGTMLISRPAAAASRRRRPASPGRSRTPTLPNLTDG